MIKNTLTERDTSSPVMSANFLFTMAIAILTLALSVTLGVQADRFRAHPRYKWPCVVGSIWCGAMSIYAAYAAGGMAGP